MMVEPYYAWSAPGVQLQTDWTQICRYYSTAISLNVPTRWIVDRAKHIYDEIQSRIKWEDGDIKSFDFSTGLSEIEKQLLTLVEGYDKLVAWDKGQTLTSYAWDIVQVLQVMYGTVAKEKQPEEILKHVFPSILEDPEEEIEKITRRKDVNPEGGKKKYGNVAFADTANSKYPIDTEEHVRAAWNYINKPKNAAKYSATDLKTIKSKIVRAWKKLIDPKGPPSAAKMVTESDPKSPTIGSIFKVDQVQQLIYAVVLEPEVLDADNQEFTKEFIAKACHDYNKDCRAVFTSHEKSALGYIVENFLAPTDFKYEGSDELVKEGSWVIAIKIADEELWKQCQDGTFTGVSISGWVFSADPEAK